MRQALLQYCWPCRSAPRPVRRRTSEARALVKQRQGRETLQGPYLGRSALWRKARRL